MGKRGMSAEEKRQKMLSIFHDQKVPFTMKQLEKLGSKAGVNSMTIKDIVQSLVDDSLVDFDKIGSSNYFWSFPSKVMVKLQTEVASVEAAIAKLNSEQKELQERYDELQSERVDSPERQEKLAALAKLQAERDALQQQIGSMKDNDPGKVVELQKKVQIAKDASIRWTDNTWTLCDYVRKKYGMPKADVERQLQMKSDFDYPEYKPPPKKRAKKTA